MMLTEEESEAHLIERLIARDFLTGDIVTYFGPDGPDMPAGRTRLCVVLAAGFGMYLDRVKVQQLDGGLNIRYVRRNRLALKVPVAP